MHFSRAVILALASFSSYVFAAEEEEIRAEVIEEVPINQINLDVSATLPEASLLGIKIFNGKPTKSIVKFVNNEEKPINIHIVGGSLWSDGVDSQNLRNLTSSKYETVLPAGETKDLEYTFSTEMHPQDVSLILATMVSLDGKYYQLQALNTTVSIVDEAASIFDPQILFLYIVLLGGFVGTGYLIYSTWIAPLFPAKNKRRFDVKTPKKSAPAEGTSTSAQTYDESWIPDHHIRKPEIKRSRSGTPAGKSRKA